MPPKARFTKEQITGAALGVVSEKGMQALTAKELGEALGTSTTPIFTVFTSMQEVQDAVKIAAMERFEEYAHKTEGTEPVLKQVGMQMIRFAKEEPKLYQLLFMSAASEANTFDDMYGHLGSVAGECIKLIEREYGLRESDAKMLFEHIWIHTFGIGALCATGVCAFSYAQLDEMLARDFTAMLMLLRADSGSDRQRRD